MWIGITNDNFRKLGHCPSMQNILNKLAKGVEIDVSTDFINCCGMLSGPLPLDVSFLDTMSTISDGVVDFIINNKGLGFFRSILSQY